MDGKSQDPNFVDKDNVTMLAACLINPDLTQLKKLLFASDGTSAGPFDWDTLINNERKGDGFTVWHYACCQDNEKFFEPLLLRNKMAKSKINFFCKTRWNSMTGLMCASFHNRTHTFKWLIDNLYNNEKNYPLIFKKFNINDTTGEGRTSFYNAILHDNYELCSFILDRFGDRVDINKADYAENSPLHVACSQQNSSLVKLLIDVKIDNKRACNVNSKGKGGKTALMKAVEYDRLAAVNYLCDLEEVLIHGICDDENQWDALDWAVNQGNIEIFCKLLETLIKREKIVTMQDFENKQVNGVSLATAYFNDKKVENWKEITKRNENSGFGTFFSELMAAYKTMMVF